MTLPVLENPVVLSAPTRAQLESVIAQLQTFLIREHRGDGTHGHVTALSLSVSGGLFEHGRAAAAGDWQVVPYRAADFTGSGGMTWGVDAPEASRRFMLIGHTLFYQVVVATSDVGGVASDELRVALPPGLVVAHAAYGALLANDAGAAFTAGRYVAGGGNAFVSCYHDPAGTPWTLTAGDNTFVAFNAVIEVQ